MVCLAETPIYPANLASHESSQAEERDLMTKRMLIDAAHPEQTRVAIVDGNRVEEFDFESQNKRQLRGNIYLAKVTRVEASLQAAFVDFGGNRHGFLAFNEIHPDYYQIPVEDRQKLLEAEAAAEAAELAAEEAQDDEEEISDTDHGDTEHDPDTAEEAQIAHEAVKKREKRRRNNYRRYKIQEVIKHGQIMLVQVVKEERGTKGAALTTYMSLAGRYCVLMPNTAKGGGISRKISNAADRKRLKNITNELDIAAGMGLIIRTAGAKRNKTEIKRDYTYLTRLWSTIREKTLESSAPALVHEEGGLVRRAVRDLYGKDIEAVLVEGEEAYKDAKSFMKMLMPSHSERVKQYKEKYPIFLRYQVEDQLETIHSPEVQLKSGGYLVIHQTEALVAIDVNSGRATRERNVEATALKTNLEAAEESCRQMRLRDLAGLIVIDFIDMEENKNNRAVEKRMKEALKRDRARVQAGRISMFGLFEMSRQRRRASVIEGSSQVCPTCNGLGVIRSTESSALQALQALESEGMRKRSAVVKLMAPSSVALYILNEKRSQLYDIENQSGMRVLVETDPEMHPPQHEIIVVEPLPTAAQSEGNPKEERAKRNKKRSPKSKTEQKEAAKPNKPVSDEDTKSKSKPRSDKAETTDETQDAEPKRKRRGRRGGRKRSQNNTETTALKTTNTEAKPVQEVKNTEPAAPEKQSESKPKRPVRRIRKSKATEAATEKPVTIAEPQTETKQEDKPSTIAANTKRKVRRTRRSKQSEPISEAQTAEPQAPEPQAAPKAEESGADAVAKAPARPKRTIRKRRSLAASEPQEATKSKPKRAPRKKETVQETEEKPAPAKKTTRTVRKRPSAATGKSTPQVEKPQETKSEKPTAKRAVRRKKAVASEAAASADESAKPKTRRKPAAKKPATKKQTDKAPKAEPETSERSPSSPPVEDAAKTPVKKTKRSWRSRIFGDGNSDE